jgi:hypothetical protein
MPSPKVASARTIANRNARMVMNRAALDELQRGMADGLLVLGQRILDDARSVMKPGHLDAPPYGEGLIASGHVLVYALGKKVGGEEGGTGKPRGMKAPKDQAVMGVWFSAPHAHFAELGTIRQPARPFLTPAVMANIGETGPYVQRAMAKRAASAPQRAMKSAEIKARIAAGGG